MSTLKTNAITTVAGKPILNSTGSILQVVSFTGNTSNTTTSSTFQASSITATITPSSTTNKILIHCAAFANAQANAAHVAWTIYRNNSVNLDPSSGLLGMGDYLTGSGSTIEGQAVVAWLDSPTTTSATIYTLYYKSYNNSTTVSVGGGRASSMVLMEVAG